MVCIFKYFREESHDRIVAIILELEFQASDHGGSTEALLPSPPPTPPSAPPLEASSSSLSTDHESFDEWRRKIQEELGQVTRSKGDLQFNAYN